MRKKKGLAAIALALALTMGLVEPVAACTGVLVGSNLTENGSFIFGRTEDLETNHNKSYVIHEAGTYKKGETIEDTSYGTGNGFKHTFTKDSYRFSAVNDTTPEYGIYDEAGFNEMGLMVDMTVSATANADVLNQDPLLNGSGAHEKDAVGLTEAIMPTIILSECATADEAVKMIADIVATKGSAEGNGLVVADAENVWYMEIYTGHQFLAMRYPKDRFSVFPNTFWINEVTLTPGETKDNYIVSKDDQYIYSKGLFETAEKAKTLNGDKATYVIKARESYAEPEVEPRNASRAASGIKALNPKAEVKVDDTAFAFLQTADEKSISVQDVMGAMRNRFENMGDLPANDAGGEGYYPIGNRNVMEAHVFELPPTRTAKFPGVEYLAIGSPLTSVFVPYYKDITSGEASAVKASNEYTNESMYWTAMDILHMVELDREKYQPMVDAVLNPVQEEILKSVSLSPASAAIQTTLNNDASRKSHEAQLQVQKTLHEELMKNGYTSSSESLYREEIPAGAFKLTVPSNTTDQVWKVTYDSEKKNLFLVDAYGNSVERFNGTLTVSVDATVLEKIDDVTFMGQPIQAKTENGAHVFTVVMQSPVARLSGQNRQEVAVNVANAYFPEAKTVILVNTMASGDAISAANLSQGESPIFYTDATKLTDVTKDALVKRQPEKVILMGGLKSISKETEDAVKAALPQVKVERVDGADRYEVNAKTVKEVKASGNLVVTTGQVFSDALMAVPYAKGLDAPVLLTKEASIPSVTEKAIQGMKDLKTVVLIGGPKSVSDETKAALAKLTKVDVTRLSDADRYSLSAIVASKFEKPEQALLVSGQVASDALTAGPVAQKLGLPLLLTRPATLDPKVSDFFDKTETLKSVVIVGGPKSVSEDVEAKVESLVK
ncbi:MAG: C69 family dipeptidase [Peptoniphilaceae bacterium]|nr:C69 family dipeptidase [Peptoniphilaceae bacterium]MDY6085410.1 C69 family dipeptidase [Peptoniphilaceae bacterium]